MDAALNQSFIKATEDIFESMLGLQLKSNPPVEKPLHDSAGETSVIINIVGSVSGAITLSCSKSFASKLASQMVGMEVAASLSERGYKIGCGKQRVHIHLSF